MNLWNEFYFYLFTFFVPFTVFSFIFQWSSHTCDISNWLKVDPACGAAHCLTRRRWRGSCYKWWVLSGWSLCVNEILCTNSKNVLFAGWLAKSGNRVLCRLACLALWAKRANRLFLFHKHQHQSLHLHPRREELSGCILFSTIQARGHSSLVVCANRFLPDCSSSSSSSVVSLSDSGSNSSGS